MVISSLPECHDYVLEKVTLDKDFAYTRAGRSLTPRIIVKNQGGDDVYPGNVPVEAWLGETPLIPVVDNFPPLKGGTSAMFMLRFMIPHDIPRRPVHLTIKIDPWNTRNECGDGTNEFTTLSLVVIEDKVKTGMTFNHFFRSYLLIPSSYRYLCTRIIIRKKALSHLISITGS